MARELDYIMQEVFRGINSYTRGTSYWYHNRSSISPGKKKYLEIPIKEDRFELPILAVNNFINLTQDNRDLSTDVITAMLFSLEKEPRYKSLDRYMRDIIIEDFIDSRLVKCEVKQGEETILYYGTHGAVFDKNFFPVMMCTWLIERVWINEETRKYKFIKPILRISPKCYIYQADPMQRWIVKKAASIGLSETLARPYNHSLNSNFDMSDSEDAKLTVEICDSPFVIKTADVPSISTTNESLLQIAIDHIEEVVA